MRVRRSTLHARRQLGGLLAFGGVMIIFVCLPMEFFLIVIGVGMTAAGVVLMDI